MMNGLAPHVVQYQGSKRLLAPQILKCMPRRFRRMVEPFSGTAAMTIAAALQGRADSYVVNDLNEPLVRMLEDAVERPQELLAGYSRVWAEQFSVAEGHLQHYYHIRDRFNAGERSPEHMLYLLARCVKGSVRYSRTGDFNQSPDKRRHGTSPQNLERNVMAVSRLLKGKAAFLSRDYREIFKLTEPGDVVYMDPPYQGVSDARDNRYLSGLTFESFAESLNELNARNVDFLVSYDGACGEKSYGDDLPGELGCRKIMLKAGLSSQALLLGRKAVTYEALYVSRGLIPLIGDLPQIVDGENAPFFPEAASW